MKYNKPFAKKINTEKICQYGCKKKAHYQFKNGKMCCSKNFNSCLGKRKNFSESADHKLNAAKSLEKRKKMGITKSSQIKATKTRKKNNHYEKLAEIMKKHWKENPWNTNPKWGKYKDTEINYQSKPEYNFLQELEEERGLEWVRKNVKRGPCFYYNDPVTKKERLYISDFQIENTIFEVKGNYTWNKHGTDKNLEKTNRAKLDSVKEMDYDVVLILEGKRIEI